jgi:transcriptional regulator with XRE-family HTH domain
MVKLMGLKHVRQRKALTQQQLADRAGVNRVTVARIEAGKDEPFPTTLRKLADALGVEPETLADAPDEPAAHSPANGPIPPLALDARITAVNPDDVARMLRAEPDLLPLVNEAAEQLFRFLPESRLLLEYVVDPEYGEPEQLFLSVSMDHDVQAATDALDRFDRAWGIPNARRSRGLLIVDLH